LTRTRSFRESTGSSRWTSIRSVLDLQEKIKATGTVNAREFAMRQDYEGPTSLARQLAPDETMVVPGDYRTATRLRD
jgi:NADH-quinone oxidoreductase subunit B